MKTLLGFAYYANPPHNLKIYLYQNRKDSDVGFRTIVKFKNNE